MIKEVIARLVEGIDLSSSDAQQAMTEIMSGQATNSQTAAFLTALRIKGETVEELTSFAGVMRGNCCKIRPKVQGRLVDTCGTGGDKLKTFNISTASAFVAAGAGITIAKHGNRSVTSKSGSADVLEKLGVNLAMEPQTVQQTIEQVGIGFMFAPAFHPAMKYAITPRREIAIRTVFNVLGPLTNPACANAQLLGVYDGKLTEPLAKTLRGLGCEEALVVHGLDGLDEISTLGKSKISLLREGTVMTMEVSPESFGVNPARIEDLQGADPEENAQILFDILNGQCLEDDAKRDIVLVNSAAAIMVGGGAEDFSSGMDVARESIGSGAAYRKLKMLVEASGGDLSRLEELEQRYA
ncbi:MAG: anthranilate phosphoribosyltransferase [Candidatus Bathyarchaeota archaeon]|nr:anthranilate phosphoribosyltransferase [Candidatus Bathyarchaeota archaeon]